MHLLVVKSVLFKKWKSGKSGKMEKWRSEERTLELLCAMSNIVIVRLHLRVPCESVPLRLRYRFFHKVSYV